MQKERNILLCVSGSTPAIITETLWCLTQGYNSEKTPYKIDEIHVITTTSGKETLENSLLKNIKFEEFKKDYPDCANIKFSERFIHVLTTEKNEKPEATDSEDIQLADVKTGEENECAANQIYLILKDLVDKSTRIHASAAGGRKTMSIYLTVMMQLLARAQDTLSHIVVWDEFESDRSFLYPPPELLRLDKPLPISLAFIPFIRLREVGKTLIEELTIGKNSYSDAVQAVRENLKLAETDEKLVLNLKDSTISFGNKSNTLTGKRMYLILLYALFQTTNVNQYLSDLEISKELLSKVFRRLSKAQGKEYTLKTFDDDIGRPVFLEDAHNTVKKILNWSPSINPNIPKDEKKLKVYLKRFKKYLTDSRNAVNESLKGFPKKIFIQNRGKYGDARFGFNIDIEIIE